MSFATPAALWGLLALALPILIHLFNANRGRRLAFGDLRFLEEAQALEMRSVFPTELLLLAARCALIAAVVLWFAQPRLDRQPEFRGASAVLLSPLALALAEQPALATAREVARRNGADLRLLGEGFPAVASLAERPTPTGGAWSLLAALEADLPPDLAVVLLVADDPREAGWRRPPIDRPVQTVEVVRPPAPAARPLAARIFAEDGRDDDARHLTAALQALAATGFPIAPTSDEDELDLALVLGSDNVAAAGLVIAEGDADPNRSDALAFAGERFAIDLADGGPPGAPLALSADGRPVAVLHAQGEQTHISFRGRFSPDRAAIVADPLFADFLAELIEAAIPARLAAAAAPPAVPLEVRRVLQAGLPPWVLVIGALWLLERWLALRAGRTAHGAS